MRVLGIDFGGRRIGLAISDASGTLARPVTTIHVTGSVEETVRRVAEQIGRLESDGDAIAAIVVGLPTRLDGSPNEQTAPAKAFAQALGAVVRVPVHLQDERLTSHEAESRLSETDRDWRTRKDRLDAAAAAVILQEYFDATRARYPVAEHE